MRPPLWVAWSCRASVPLEFPYLMMWRGNTSWIPSFSGMARFSWGGLHSSQTGLT
ncbi:hypothetical protein M408DRAFT_333163 [Serendipita vermifera MAFF 305830]|uniref:Uncharacterized protein n=1 Tax=Serendipita vermifera MAFF 305830 TaxID=933852 RepID=A0A0C3APF7_SERVB|nr:hypothetical protein M408DRAFT_333163 [Serendipita vermifera MAFF 305830]